MDGDALKLQTEAMARVLGEVAQGQQELQDSTQQLEVQLRSAWLSHAHQKFEVLKVGGSQPWGSQHPDSHPELASRAFPCPPSGQPPSTMANTLCDPGKNSCPFSCLSLSICK